MAYDEEYKPEEENSEYSTPEEENYDYEQVEGEGYNQVEGDSYDYTQESYEEGEHYDEEDSSGYDYVEEPTIPVVKPHHFGNTYETNQTNSTYVQHNTQNVSNQAPNRESIGFACGFFLSLLGLILGLMFYGKKPAEKSTFIKGWLHGLGYQILAFIVLFVGRIFFALYFSL